MEAIAMAAGAAQLLTVFGLILLIAVRLRCGEKRSGRKKRREIPPASQRQA
jgi:hypothetical protein